MVSIFFKYAQLRYNYVVFPTNNLQCTYLLLLVPRILVLAYICLPTIKLRLFHETLQLRL